MKRIDPHRTLYLARGRGNATLGKRVQKVYNRTSGRWPWNSVHWSAAKEFYGWIRK